LSPPNICAGSRIPGRDYADVVRNSVGFRRLRVMQGDERDADFAVITAGAGVTPGRPWNAGGAE